MGCCGSLPREGRRPQADVPRQRTTLMAQEEEGRENQSTEKRLFRREIWDVLVRRTRGALGTWEGSGRNKRVNNHTGTTLRNSRRKREGNSNSDHRWKREAWQGQSIRISADRGKGQSGEVTLTMQREESLPRGGAPGGAEPDEGRVQGEGGEEGRKYPEVHTLGIHTLKRCSPMAYQPTSLEIVICARKARTQHTHNLPLVPSHITSTSFLRESPTIPLLSPMPFLILCHGIHCPPKPGVATPINCPPFSPAV